MQMVRWSVQQQVVAAQGAKLLDVGLELARVAAINEQLFVAVENRPFNLGRGWLRAQGLSLRRAEGQKRQRQKQKDSDGSFHFP